jgi:hypothetical protein
MPEALRALLPRVRLRVGVTGHRTGPKLPPEALAPIRQTIDRLVAAIAASARDVLAQGKRGLVDTSLELVLISALAEGADRVAAEAGLAADYSLEAVLPFAKAEYLLDFESAESRAAFESLLGRATSVLELDGGRKQANRAYEAAGLVTLANCDLLIAIWDQNEAAGVGGTALVVDRAVNDGIPVVLINPAQSERASLLWAADIALTPASVRHEDLELREALEEIHGVVDLLIAPPQTEPSRSKLAIFLAEKERRWNFGPWYALLLFAFGGQKLQRRDFELPPYLATTRAQWADYTRIAHRDDRLAKAIDQILLPAFAFADNLSIHYARIYRSVYVFNYIAAAIVATLAVFGLFLHQAEWLTFVQIGEVVELVIIGAVILSWRIGHHLQWHRRWLEYRRLAECLRHMRLIALTASVGPIIRPGRSPDDDTDWVDWYARAIRRLLPLPQQKVDPAYVEMVKSATCDAEVSGQISYHQSNATLMETLDHRMHRLGLILFVATAFTLGAALALPQTHAMHGWKTILIFLTVVFPIFGSAFNAIRAQGDFISVARRSRRTAVRLVAISKALSGEPLTFARLADRIETASDMMMGDLVEWQLVFRARPLSLPV